MSAEPWDQLLDTIDQFAGHDGPILDEDVESAFAELITEAIATGWVDPELHIDYTARWITALLVAHRNVRDTHPHVPPDADAAVLRLIVTRWLHPHRLDQRASAPRT